MAKPSTGATSGPTAAVIRTALKQFEPRNVPTWRPLLRVWSLQLKSRPAREVIRLATHLLDDGLWGRVTAYALVANHPGGLAALTPAVIRRFARGLDDWVSVDTFACYLAGPAWREGLLPTDQVHAWLRSKDRWLRRTAVVCTVSLNLRSRGGRGDTARTLAICRQAVADRDDMVVKALSWALRSLILWDRKAVCEFLVEHEDALAGRVRREVSTKLRTGLKN